MSDNTNGCSVERWITLDNVPPNKTTEICPDKRVNYARGMVLSEAEFIQDQVYYLIKHYLHNEYLHGYGTVEGLTVTCEKGDGPVGTTPSQEDEADIKDILVKVDAGIGIDQCGRMFNIPMSSSVYQAWVRKCIEEHLAEKSSSYTPHKDGNIDIPVYVTAAYGEAKADQSGLLGEPCDPGDTATQHFARRVDSVALKLTIDPKPRMRLWEKSRIYARMLANIRVYFGDGDETDTGDNSDTLLEDVNALSEDRANPISLSVYNIPVEKLTSTLEQVSRTWLTVRNTIRNAALNDGCAVVLRTLNVEWDPNTSKIIDFTDHDNDRPYVHDMDTIIPIRDIDDLVPQPPRTFATIQLETANTLTMWVHYPTPLAFTAESLALKVNGQNVNITQIATPDNAVSNVFRLTTETAIAWGARMRLVFLLENITLNNGSNPPTTLSVALDASPLVYLNQRANKIILYTFARSDFDTRELATVYAARKGNEDKEPLLRLWFHLDNAGAAVTDFPADAIRSIKRNNEEKKGDFELLTRETNARHNTWRLGIVKNATPLTEGEHIQITLDTDKIKIGVQTLRTWMRARYLNLENNGQITLFCVVRLPSITDADIDGLERRVATAESDITNVKGRLTTAESDITDATGRLTTAESDITGTKDRLTTAEDTIKLLDARKTLPFVTITPLKVDKEGLTYELWFHLDQDAAKRVFDWSNVTVWVYAETTTGTNVVFQGAPHRERMSVYTVRISPQTQAPDDERRYDFLEYTRFVFPLSAENMVKTSRTGTKSIPLRQFITENNIKFEGHQLVVAEDKTTTEVIVAYARHNLKYQPEVRDE